MTVQDVSGRRHWLQCICQSLEKWKRESQESCLDKALSEVFWAYAGSQCVFMLKNRGVCNLYSHLYIYLRASKVCLHGCIDTSLCVCVSANVFCKLIQRISCADRKCLLEKGNSMAFSLLSTPKMTQRRTSAESSVNPIMWFHVFGPTDRRQRHWSSITNRQSVNKKC